MSSNNIILLKIVGEDFLYNFAILNGIFIPFTFRLTSINQTITTFLFEDLTVWLNDNIFHFQILNPTISSDSTTLYLLIFILTCFALIETILLQLVEIWKSYRTPFLTFIRLVLTYYLALILLKYGFDKVFKGQFYLPEPNMLYTPFGQLSPDILYWSTVGTSYEYNLFLGGSEILAASLLLFKRTRLLGLIFSLSVFIQIVAINFSFDISVKVFSCYLLFLTLLLLSPYFKVLYHFLIQRASMLQFPKDFIFNNAFWKPTLKTFIISLFLLEATFFYTKRWNFNDDLAARPFWHGAYEVIEEGNDYDTVTTDIEIKRFFIHRHNYLIFQDQKDKMGEGFKFHIIPERQELVAADLNEAINSREIINYQFNEKDTTLTIEFTSLGGSFYIKGKALNWKRLPALRKPFHWSIDSY